MDVEVVDQRAVRGELGSDDALDEHLAVVAVDLAQGVADVALVVGGRAPRAWRGRPSTASTSTLRAFSAPATSLGSLASASAGIAIAAGAAALAAGATLVAGSVAGSVAGGGDPAGLRGGLLGGGDGAGRDPWPACSSRGGGRRRLRLDFDRLRAQDREPGSKEHDGADEEDANGRGDLAHDQSIGISPPEVEQYGVYAGGGTVSRTPTSASCARVDRGRRAGQRVRAGGRLRERDHVADRVAVGEDRDDPVDAEREPAVRRRAVLQRVEQEAEARVGLLLGDPERGEDLLLDLGRWIRIDPPPISEPSSTMSYARERSEPGSSKEPSGAVNGWCSASQRFSPAFHSNIGKSTTHSSSWRPSGIRS